MGHLPTAFENGERACQMDVYETTSRLLMSMRRSETLEDGDWHLIRRLLAYAADAEQQISTQKDRIAELEQRSMSDDLTGLLNWRGFEKALDETIGRASANQVTGLLILIDPVGLDKINREHGYAAGDAALVGIAGELRKSVGEKGQVGRIGGDEFAVLLPDASEPNARARAMAFKVLLNGIAISNGRQKVRIRVQTNAMSFDGTCKARELLQAAELELHSRPLAQAS